MRFVLTCLALEIMPIATFVPFSQSSCPRLKNVNNNLLGWQRTDLEWLTGQIGQAKLSALW
jgi:hypothetical protein